MIYSALLGHLESINLKVGDKVKYGTFIGVMGNTGTVEPKPTPANPTAGTHLHLSVIEGVKDVSWTLASMVSTNKPSQQECKFFIEDDIFGENGKTVVTNGWLGYTNHYGYDIVNKNGSKELYWNRNFEGIVTAVKSNSGYGNYIVIVYSNRASNKTQEIAQNNEKQITEYKDTINALNEQTDALKQEISIYKDRITSLEQEIINLKKNYGEFVYEVKQDGIHKIKLFTGEKLLITEFKKPAE